jgi:hypothetical protein
VIAPPKTRRFSDPFLALLGVRIVLWLAATRTMLPGLFKDAWKLESYHDEHFYYAHEDIARLTVAKFHELPAWNPFYCGGIPGIGNPQDSTLAPEFLLKLVFGVGPGRHLAYLLFVMLGMEGTYRLARRFDASVIGAAFGGVMFATCGFFLDVLKLGWLNFFTFELVPWAALAFLTGLRKPWARVGGGAIVGWMALSGGHYTVPYTVLLLGVLVAITTGQILAGPPRADRPAWHAPIVTFATIGVCSVAFSAAKLLPMLKVVAQAPRIWEVGEVTEAQVLFDRMLHAGPFDGQPGHVGGFVIALALLGAAIDRRAAIAIGIGGFFFLVAMGDFGPLAPHVLIHKLPIFAQLRSPHRFVLITSLCCCVAAAVAIGRLEDLAPAAARVVRDLASPHATRRLGLSAQLLLGAVGALLTAKLALFAWTSYATEAALGDTWTTDTPRPYAAPFRQSRGNRWDQQVWAPASLGSLQCFEETAFPQSDALDGNAAQEEYPADPSVAKVERLSWSPNAITLRVVASAETMIRVNQNWHPSWRSDVGQVFADRGLLAVRVPAGDRQVKLHFRDRLVLAGGLISSATWLGILLFGLRSLLRRGRAWLADLRAAPWIG